VILLEQPNSPNYQDAGILLQLFDRFELEEMHAARNFVLHELEVATIDAFNDMYSPHCQESRYFHKVYRFFEMVGTLYKNKLVHPDLLFDVWYINDYYNKLYPIFDSWRKKGDAHIAENFEYLAFAELEWIASAKGEKVVPDLPYWNR
jgi:hypothetical protein